MLPSFPSAQDTVICRFYQFSGITATCNDAKFPCYNRGMTGASSFVSDYGSCLFMIGSQSGFVKSVTNFPSNFSWGLLSIRAFQ
jgi:hypothetical protein